MMTKQTKLTKTELNRRRQEALKRDDPERWKAGMDKQSKNSSRRRLRERKREKEAKEEANRETATKNDLEEIEGNEALEALTIRIAVLEGFDTAGVAFFSDPNCKFSDPSGVGASLPAVVTSILSTLLETVSDEIMSAENAGNQEVSIVKYEEMRAILPPHANKTPPCIMLFLLKILGTYLGDDERREEFELGYYGHTDFDAGNFVGLREINGGRFEIFMDDDDRPHGCFNAVIKRMLRELAKPTTPQISDGTLDKLRKCLLRYCNYLAKLDGRISNLPYDFQNHAIIASYGEVNAQDIHTDLDNLKQYQFGVLLTANSPPTLEYKAQLPVLSAGDSMTLTTIWKDIDPNLDQLLLSKKENRAELDCYGCLLSNPAKVGRDLEYEGHDHGVASGLIPEEDLFPIGTLISLPGMVAHGGPKTTSFRAVIFFTGAPVGVEAYDSDKQANRTMLVGNMLYHSWMDMIPEQRVWLLRKWYEECLSKDEFAVGNLVHIHLQKLGRCLQAERLSVNKKNENKQSELIRNLIQKFASHSWDVDSWNGTDDHSISRAFKFAPKYKKFDIPQ